MIDDIADKLVSLGLVGGATGWSVYKGLLPDDPDTSVAIYLSPGGLRDKSQGDANDIRDYVIRVRAGPFGYESARTKADAVFSNMNNATITGLAWNVATGSVGLLGYDGNDRPILEIAFRAMVQP